MSNLDGDVSFGFAPHGRSGQQKAERLSRPRTDDPSSPSARYDVASHYDAGSSSTQAHWVWLLIGILLGSGGTLIASSVWLSDGYLGPSIAMDATPAVADVLEDQKAMPLPDGTAATVLAEDGAWSKDEKGDPPHPTTADLENALVLTGNDGDKATKLTDAEESGSTLISPEEKAETLARVEVTSADQPPPSDPISDNSKTLETFSTETLSTAGDGTVTENLAVSDVTTPTPSIAARSTKVEAATTIKTASPRPLQPEPDNGETEIAAATEKNDVDHPENRLGEQLLTSPKPEEKPLSTGGNDPSDSFRVADIVRAANEKETAKLKPTTPRRSGRIYRVQLAAVNDETAAQTYWKEVQERLPDLFTEIEPLFDRREVGKQIFYRVWVGEFDKRIDADDYCGWLKDKGQDCFVTRG